MLDQLIYRYKNRYYTLISHLTRLNRLFSLRGCAIFDTLVIRDGTDFFTSTVHHYLQSELCAKKFKKSNTIQYNAKQC